MQRDSYATGKRLLSEGHVLQAIDHFRGAMLAEGFRTDLEYGLMLARSRATPGPGLFREIEECITRAESQWRWQFRCIQAKLLKAEGGAQLAQSAQLYLDAYEQSSDTYPGVNAASLLLLCGRDADARRLASALLARLAQETEEDYWLAATRGELAVLLGDSASAIEAYRKADQLSRGRHGDRASIRKQLQLLASGGSALADEVLADAFSRPRVAVFSGHRIDAPGAIPRFPAAAEGRVAAALAQFAEHIAGGVSFSSAASGGDILFAEAMLARGVGVHIVLPVPPEQFVEGSVREAGGDWVRRFEDVLARATRVVVAHHAVNSVPAELYHYTNLLSDGLAQLHAESIDGELMHCAVLCEGVAARVAGGTRQEVDRWESRSYRIHRIDPLAAKGGDSPAPVQGAAPSLADSGPLSVRAMLFADLVGSSRVPPEDIPALFGQFLSESRRLIDELGVAPRMRNTWGDAVFLVFDSVPEAARLAAGLARGIRWPERSDGVHPTVRVSMHAGPVVERYDPVLERNNVFGHHVIRAARIEPVTPPGEVFATEEAAALLRATGDVPASCVYMGRIAMPKGFGETPIYRIDL